MNGERFQWRPFLLVVALLGAPLEAGVSEEAGKGVLLPVVEKARRTAAMSECRNLENAIRAYLLDYNRMPIKAGKKPRGAVLVLSGSHFMAILHGEDPEQNPRERQYFMGKPAKKMRGGVDADGNLWDPWGNPYRIFIDADYDGIIQHEAFEGEIRSEVLVLSAGPDGRAFTRDDINPNDDARSED